MRRGTPLRTASWRKSKPSSWRCPSHYAALIATTAPHSSITVSCTISQALHTTLPSPVHAPTRKTTMPTSNKQTGATSASSSATPASECPSGRPDERFVRPRVEPAPQSLLSHAETQGEIPHRRTLPQDIPRPANSLSTDPGVPTHCRRHKKRLAGLQQTLNPFDLIQHLEAT